MTLFERFITMEAERGLQPQMQRPGPAPVPLVAWTTRRTPIAARAAADAAAELRRNGARTSRWTTSNSHRCRCPERLRPPA